ncbi:MAG TPA: GNAT family N-acetyltransferase [Pseudonocardia sp.]|nr:GNAT family N-acetyltransferase [Pseudonocardia sp.]
MLVSVGARTRTPRDRGGNGSRRGWAESRLVRVEVRLHDDVEEFALLALPLLEADPARHTIVLTVLDRLRRTGERPGSLVTVHGAAAVCGAALRAGSAALLVSALPASAAGAVDAVLAEADPELTAVSGPVAEAEAYAAAYTARSGAAAQVGMRMRLFALGELRPPVGVPGEVRFAVGADLDLLTLWWRDFNAEALHGRIDMGDPREAAVRSLADGRVQLLWEDGGKPVALAVTGVPVARMARIGPVYTPVRHRGHGYGSAVTAAAAAWALGAGAAEVVLFTDLANPVSNSIYPRIGFRPVLDALELTFTEAV